MPSTGTSASAGAGRDPGGRGPGGGRDLRAGLDRAGSDVAGPDTATPDTATPDTATPDTATPVGPPVGAAERAHGQAAPPATGPGAGYGPARERSPWEHSAREHHTREQHLRERGGREPGGQFDQRAAPGTLIGGRYALRTAIGNGGMGTVWRATDTVLRRDVAVKEVLLPPGMAPTDRDAMYQRTLREARAAAALSHPAVVQVYDVVTDAGRPWIVMELLQARSLAEMIVEDGPLAARAVAKIGIALLGALEVAHAAGVLHRDVKPANVLICADGRCVLTDFGVARMPTDSELTTPGMVLGSPHFISPERAIGAKFGPPSDLFSLGVTLYTAVEGRPPFDKRDPFETMRAVVEEPPAPALRAGALAGVLYGLLEKDPARRWDVAAARGVLRDLLHGPLASNAPAHVTDPYAVVRPTPYQPPPAPPTTGQIGGRAMLAPGETVSAAIKRMHGPVSAPPAGAEQRGGGQGRHATRRPEPAAPRAPAQRGAHGLELTDAEQRFTAVPHGGADWTQPPRPPDQGRHAPRPNPPIGAGALAQLRRVPPVVLAAVAAGAVGLLVLGILAVTGQFSGGGGTGGGGAPPRAKTSTAVNRPLIDVQEYRDERGIVVNVPKAWTRSTASSYVDFTDPADKTRRLRINIEIAATARRFLEVAENGLKSNKTSCPTPYSRVNLNDAVTLDSKPAAELEYTCGVGDQQRHGLWRALVVGGKSYHFFLTVPEPKYTDSKVVYDEMVRSFHLTLLAGSTPSGT